MKIKTLALGILAAMMFASCGNGNNTEEPKEKAQTSENWQEIKPQEIDTNAVN